MSDIREQSSPSSSPSPHLEEPLSNLRDRSNSKSIQASEINEATTSRPSRPEESTSPIHPTENSHEPMDLDGTPSSSSELSSLPDPPGGPVKDLNLPSWTALVQPSSGHALRMWDGAYRALGLMQDRQEFVREKLEQGSLEGLNDAALAGMADLEKAVAYAWKMYNECLEEQEYQIPCPCCKETGHHDIQREEANSQRSES